MTLVVIDPKAALISMERTGQAKPSPSIPALLAGESLKAAVVEKLPDGQYLINVKQTLLAASSDIPLKAGDQIQVRVAGLSPQIILSVIDPAREGQAAKIQENLIQWRSQPDALASLLSRSGTFLTALSGENLPVNMTRQDIGQIPKLMEQIIFSPKTKDAELFVRTFADRLGLTHEALLAATVRAGAKGDASVFADSIKSLMMKLAESLAQPGVRDGKWPPQMTQTLQTLASFATDAIKTIEARQVLNVVFGQTENGLYLQIPMAMGNALSLADVFIRPDDSDQKGKGRFENAQVTIFLNLDILGQIAIEAGLREGRFRCVISCHSEETQALVAAHSDILWAALEGLGYRVETIRCDRDAELEARKNAFIAAQSFSQMSLINHYA